MEPIAELDAQGLRKFGLVTGGVFALLFTGVPYVRHDVVHVWPLVLGGVLWASALVVPLLLRWPYKLWMKLGGVLGWINTRIILTVFFLVVLLPLALLMRALGKDPLERRIDPTRTTYRTPSRVRPVQTLERPF